LELLANNKIIKEEINYSFDSILKIKNNESSWNYLRGLAKFHIEFKSEILDRFSFFFICV
jgi:hypothetical protein